MGSQTTTTSSNNQQQGQSTNQNNAWAPFLTQGLQNAAGSALSGIGNMGSWLYSNNGSPVQQPAIDAYTGAMGSQAGLGNQLIPGFNATSAIASGGLDPNAWQPYFNSQVPMMMAAQNQVWNQQDNLANQQTQGQRASQGALGNGIDRSQALRAQATQPQRDLTTQNILNTAFNNAQQTALASQQQQLQGSQGLGALAGVGSGINQGWGQLGTGFQNLYNSGASAAGQIAGALSPFFGAAGTNMQSSGTSSGTGKTSTPFNWLDFGGALGSAAITAYSDARIKENIQPVGILFDGQTPVFSFNFKGDPKPQIGLIAQEVGERMPEAVGQDDRGVLTVNYDLATRPARMAAMEQEGVPSANGGARVGDANGNGIPDQVEAHFNRFTDMLDRRSNRNMGGGVMDGLNAFFRKPTTATDQNGWSTTTTPAGGETFDARMKGAAGQLKGLGQSQENSGASAAQNAMTQGASGLAQFMNGMQLPPAARDGGFIYRPGFATEGAVDDEVFNPYRSVPVDAPDGEPGGYPLAGEPAPVQQRPEQVQAPEPPPAPGMLGMPGFGGAAGTGVPGAEGAPQQPQQQPQQPGAMAFGASGMLPGVSGIPSPSESISFQNVVKAALGPEPSAETRRGSSAIATAVPRGPAVRTAEAPIARAPDATAAQVPTWTNGPAKKGSNLPDWMPAWMKAVLPNSGAMYGEEPNFGNRFGPVLAGAFGERGRGVSAAGATMMSQNQLARKQEYDARVRAYELAQSAMRWNAEQARAAQALKLQQDQFGLQQDQFGLQQDRFAEEQMNNAPTRALKEQELFDLQNPEAVFERRRKQADSLGMDRASREYREYVATGDFSKLAAQKDSLEMQVAQRKAEAEKLGMTASHPAYQSYILTGRLPREDQQPLSATDKKFIEEADDAVRANKNALIAIDQAKELSANANSGWFAGARGTIGRNLPGWMVHDSISSPESSSATGQYENIITGLALESLKSTFGAAPTEGERKILLDLQASIGLPHADRLAILERAAAAAQRRLEYNEQKAAQLRNKDYYKPEGERTGPKLQKPIQQMNIEELKKLKGMPLTDEQRRVAEARWDEIRKAAEVLP